MVAMDLGSPPLPKKSLPVTGALEQVASRLSSKVAAEAPHGSKQELPDLKGEWPGWQEARRWPGCSRSPGGGGGSARAWQLRAGTPPQVGPGSCRHQDDSGHLFSS